MSLSRRSLFKHAFASACTWMLASCRRGPAQGGPEQRRDFGAGALRLDLRHQRANGREEYALERLRFEPHWRAPGRLVDGIDWGDYRLSVYSGRDDALLFRQGFDSNLGIDARSGATRLSVRLPMPQRPVRVSLERRRAEHAFEDVSKIEIDPAQADIDVSPAGNRARARTMALSGAPETKVDLAILGDGYRESEQAKFLADAARAARYLFSVDPFSKRAGDFNVYAVFVASAESGVTDPYLGAHKDTALRCAYYSGGSERTLAARDEHVVREVASAVPYDFVLILANARRYGGSAYFRGPAVVAIDSAAAAYLVLHEFAHVIGGLAEEYYVPGPDGPTFRGNVEPWHPNVTISSEKAKWREPLAAPPVGATPWNKAEYERYFADYVRRYERLRARGADEALVEHFMQEESRRQSALLAKNGEKRRVGLFEGAHGYAKGVYRAEVDCIMFSLQTDYFCSACASAIERTIDAHCV